MSAARDARVRVALSRLPHGRGLDLPRYATRGSAGMDLLAAVEGDLVLEPGHRALVPTGIAIQLPPGHDAQVRPHSGLALKHGVTVLNTPGTIDSDYRGEVGVVLVNLGQAPFTVTHGSRIAQLVIGTYAQAELIVTDSLDDSERGSGGFGSTGLGGQQSERRGD